MEPGSSGADVQTWMSLENGMPLLMERKVGQGRVLLFTGTMDMAWGNFPLQAVFMPIIQRIVTELGAQSGGAAARLSGVVDQSVAVSIPNASVDVMVEGPEGPVASRIHGDRVTFVPTRAGAYEVQVAGAPSLAWVAVNVDPAESDIRPGKPLLEQAVEIDRDRFTRRVEIGPYLWWAVLFLALVQAFVSIWLGRRQEDPEEDSLNSSDEVPSVV